MPPATPGEVHFLHAGGFGGMAHAVAGYGNCRKLMVLSSKRRAAVLTAFTFVLATVVIPALHLAFHELPHDHARAQTHYHGARSGGVEEHGDPHHHHDADHDLQAEVADHRHHGGDDGTNADEDPPFDPNHGAGSTAHFSLGISEAVAGQYILPLQGLVPASGVSSRLVAFAASAHVSVERFRGPPCV